ncbi:hypothetical protein J437_LFUL009946, partial [Ladona fulva]
MVLPFPQPELIAHYGYPVEIHEVVTEDGYYLTMHRIPHGINQEPTTGKPVAFLQHGLFCSSSDWVIMGPSKGLAYILADAGYDVWMGNARGNTYSKKNVGKTEEDYWNFSWHEMGVYDLPAEIDYVIAHTGQPNMYYIGHSMGTTMFYVMGSMRPEYNTKIRAQFSLAPVAFMDGVRSPMALLAPFVDSIDIITGLLGVNELFPSTALFDFLGAALCKDEAITQSLCTNILFLICGYNSKQLNETTIPVIVGHTPAGASTKTVIHYGQEYNSEKFCQYDYGWITNILKYHQVSPPDYKLSLITAPVYLHYSRNDWLSGHNTELVSYYGYPIEEHQVKTEDGYLLTMHRIPHGKGDESRVGRPAVFLQHGLITSSSDWVIMGPQKGLAYILADAGFDVWMGNARGNQYSRSHVTLTPDDAGFWKFSWHEMGLYDLPAEIDYILLETGEQSIFYIGHSMGSTTFYVMTSQRPEYNEKIRAQFSLAPIAYLTHLRSPLRIFAPFANQLEWISTFFGIDEFLPDASFLDFMGGFMCDNEAVTQSLCGNVLFQILGHDSKQLNKVTMRDSESLR